MLTSPNNELKIDNDYQGRRKSPFFIARAGVPALAFGERPPPRRDPHPFCLLRETDDGVTLIGLATYGRSHVLEPDEDQPRTTIFLARFHASAIIPIGECRLQCHNIDY